MARSLKFSIVLLPFPFLNNIFSSIKMTFLSGGQVQASFKD